MFPLPDWLNERYSPAALAACGLHNQGLVTVGAPDGPQLTAKTLEAFQELKYQAQRAGFDLRVESGYRSYERQLSIWNRKATGRLPLLDSESQVLDRFCLSDAQCVDAILNWSALPGTSRHHWGTDLDIIDAAALPSGYEVQLIPAETDGEGLFAPLHRWLDERIAQRQACGFHRVYESGRGLVRPERWHLSYAPEAQHFEHAFEAALLTDLYNASGLELASDVLDRLPGILTNYVTCYFAND